MTTGVRRIDHLVYACADLSRGIREIENLTGVRAAFGGQHHSWGTQNALLALGSDTYLEIIAPDPSQPAPLRERPFGIDELRKSRLVTWAARGTDLEGVTRAAAQAGVSLGDVLSGSRLRSDGVQLSWQLTSPWAFLEGGTIPFFIDWGDSAHPAVSAPRGLSLVELRAEHPSPPVLARAFEALGIKLSIVEAADAALVATIDGPAGRIEVR